MTTSGLNLRCRTEPVSGTVITSFPPGTRVEITGPVSNGWYPVRCASQDGWAAAEFIALDSTPTATVTPVTPTATTTPVTPTVTATATATTPSTTTFGTVTNTGGATLRCRVAPVSGEILTTFAPGAQVELRGPVSNGWYPVRCAGQDGFVSAQYLTVSGTPPTTTPGITFGTVTNTDGDNLRCRTAPVDGSVIVSLEPGSRVEVRGPVASGWYPVRCGGQNGFVSAQYLTVSGTPPPTATATATPVTPTATVTPDPVTTFGTVTNTGGAALRCRVAPVSGEILTTFGPGARVELRGPVSNGWYPVRCAGQNGFVSAEYLTVDGGSEPDPGPTTGFIDTAGAVRANCRTQPSLSGAIITTVAFGAEVTIRGNASAGWTPVRCGNQDGWISSQLISSQPPTGFGPVAQMDRTVRAANVTRARRRSRAAALVTNNAVRPGKQRPTLR
ncbi:MAG: SH3 domain-containing protein [Chloroflexia bacterium]|nr:SH3 domain-containing protein [Chloroflexia bacterium]